MCRLRLIAVVFALVLTVSLSSCTKPVEVSQEPSPPDVPVEDVSQPTEHVAGQEGKPWERPGTAAGQEIVGPDGGTMVWVAAGSFRMGSTDEEARYAVDKLDALLPDWITDEDLTYEQPAREVEMDGFWLGKHEVTNAQYRRFWQATGWGLSPESKLGDGHPFVGVSWDGAAAYAEHFGLSLPTEAQWEYGARGPASRVFPWGDEWDPSRLCWGGNLGPEGITFPVGSFPSGVSWCGALDMAGNAFEWCADWYQKDYYAGGPPSNPPGPSEEQATVVSGAYRARVLRGGGWFLQGYFCRSAGRYCDAPTEGDFFTGFRVARSCR